MNVPEGLLFIGGKWTPPVKGKKLPLINPATEEIITHVASATEEDVSKAVAAAKKAFEATGYFSFEENFSFRSNAWSTLSGTQRAKYLKAISEGVTKRKEHLAKLETIDCGKPHRQRKHS